VAAQADIDKVRDWVGDLPDDDTVDATLERWDGDVDLAALSILRRRRTAWVDLDNPTEFAIAGDASWKTTGNLAALDRLIANLEDRTNTAVTLPTVTVARLTRTDWSRDPCADGWWWRR
jgi:hypothetical protein